MALLPSGFFALAWRERLERVGRETRGFLRDRERVAQLRERRNALLADLAAFARLAEETSD
jgi:hypothetical protein